jgi:transcriptional regulator with XRE-family HTH domain
MPRTPKRAQREPRPGSRFLADVLADNIAGYRSMRKLSQRALADEMRRLGHQWSASTVSDIENGDRSVAVDELVGLALVLDTNPPALLDPGGIDGNATEDLDYGDGVTPVKFARAWLRGKVVLSRRVVDPDDVPVWAAATANDTSPNADEVLLLVGEMAFGRKLNLPENLVIRGEDGRILYRRGEEEA